MNPMLDHFDKTQSDTAEQALEIGGRLSFKPSPRLIDTAFRRELDHQIPLFDGLCRVDLAHTLVLIENGVVPAADGHALLKALLTLQTKPADFHPSPDCGDLYTNREAWLASKTAAAGQLGAGRARREAITTAFVIKQRELLIELTGALTHFVETLVDRSEQFISALMPDYTYLQSAQPTSFGHYLLGFAYPTLRDIERIQALYARLNLSPAGCGSSNGSRIPQSRQRLAELLGFDDLVSHARDAMWQADLQIEMAAVLSAIAVNLDRLAEDLQIFATEEFGLIELDDQHARASKIMPQKKNPFALTHIRGVANSMIGTLAGTAAMGRTPTGQPDNRLQLYGSLPQAMSDVTDAVSLMSEVIALLTFHHSHARNKLDHSFSMATELAEILVLQTDLSFREAHKLVGTLVRKHLSAGHLNNLALDEIEQCAAMLFGKSIQLEATALIQALNPEAAIEMRNEAGGAAIAAMTVMIKQCRQSLCTAHQWCERQRKKLETADILLQQAIQAFLNSFSVP